MQTRGVQPGVNALTFALEQIGDAKVESLVVFDDSGIESTPLPPPKLELKLDLPTNSIGVGESFSIGWQLTSVGGRGVTAVDVGAIYEHSAFALTGPNPQRLSAVDATESGTFTFTTQSMGKYRILVGAESPSSHPVAEIEVTVGQTKTGGFDTYWWGGLAGLVGLALLITLASRLLRSGRLTRRNM